MTNIDTLLIQALSDDTNIPPRDLRTLKSLAKTVSSPSFITANQGRLLLSLVREHKDILGINLSDIDNPTWSRPFRAMDKTRKLYIDNALHRIVVEFGLSNHIKSHLVQHHKDIEGLVQELSGKKYHADLTEKNIVLLVNICKPLQFEIDSTIESYYESINDWKFNDTISQYRINTITHPNFQKHLVNDLGINTPLDNNLIADRSIRYQYFVDKTIDPKTLTEIIAYRQQPKVWIDKTIYSIKDIILSLIELKRLPLLLVFDNYKPADQTKILLEISDVLDELNITDVGIYFRTSNKSDAKAFNEIIADKQYNCVLNKDTVIAGVESGKIPKFMLKSDWKPMSVVTLGTQLKHSKTAVYSNCCDLIITYMEKEPLIDYKQLW
jgi:hypothetical protein